ncbi:MAG: glycosyltransferase family 2 protein [Ruminococcus sp.]|nr:glycosyltransferase family 2 protein [Ruminococcus sp.]
MNEILTIIIPTYNRCSDVCKQTKYLDECITEYGLENKIKVVVTDNHSEDGTYVTLLQLQPQIKNQFEFRTQEKNIGGTYNSRSVLKTVETPYTMLLGDDDFLDKQYLNIVIDYIERDAEITAIFPNFHSNTSKNCRDGITEDRIYEPGTKNLGMMFKAHQMSGLVFKTEGVLDTLFAMHGENRYYQVYCMGFNMLRGKAVHITRCPMCVNDTNKKYWSYGNDSLWDDMFLNIRLLDISEKTRKEMERYYLLNYSWSVFPRFLKHPIVFMKSIASLENMTKGTKRLVIPYMIGSSFLIVYRKKIKKVGKVK